MKIIPIYKLNILLCIIASLSELSAQQIVQKLRENFQVIPDVNLQLNSNHTSVLFESWDQNSIQIEAYIEGNFPTSSNRQKALDNWKIEVKNTPNGVVINSVTARTAVPVTSMNNVQEQIAINSLAPIISEMLAPILQNIENNPMPSALPKSSLAAVNFARSKSPEEERYIQQWDDQIKEKFGEELKAKKTKRDLKNLGWEGEQFAKQMESWSTEFSGELQITQNVNGNVTVYKYRSSSKVPKLNRVLKIKIPRKAKLHLNSRHGDVTLAGKSKDVRASLSHTIFTADVIDGQHTLIKASYSPVIVNTWQNGSLIVNYVKNCKIQKANAIMVNTDSSNLYIGELNGKGAISSVFGGVHIASVKDQFAILDLSLINSDVRIQLPETAFQVNYTGSQSNISLPKEIKADARRNFSTFFVNGYHKTRNTDKMITIDAKYSGVVLQ